MNHKPAVNLSRFCQLVRDGKIPAKEVNRLMQRYAEKDLSASFKRIIDTLRDEAHSNIDDEFRADTFITIASLTLIESDIDFALAYIDKANGPLRDELLISFAKALAEAGKVEKAREISQLIRSSYFRAESLICIADQTKNPQDFRKAREQIGLINDEFLACDASCDLQYIETHNNKSAVVKKRDRNDALQELVVALSDIIGFEEAHAGAVKIGSASLRIKFLAALAKVISQKISN